MEGANFEQAIDATRRISLWAKFLSSPIFERIG
jgi:hypothetical protein